MIVELGRLTQDVELKTITNAEKGEIAVFNNRIAITTSKNLVTYIDVTAWGKLAEFIARHFKKGDELYIEGYLRNKDYSVGDKTIQVPYILIESVKFTHGNKRE